MAKASPRETTYKENARAVVVRIKVTKLRRNTTAKEGKHVASNEKGGSRRVALLISSVKHRDFRTELDRRPTIGVFRRQQVGGSQKRLTPRPGLLPPEMVCQMRDDRPNACIPHQRSEERRVGKECRYLW